MVYLKCENGLTQFAGKYVYGLVGKVSKKDPYILQPEGKDFQQT